LNPTSIIPLSKRFLTVAALFILVVGSPAAIIPAHAASDSKIVYVVICIDTEALNSDSFNGKAVPHPTMNVSEYSRTTPMTVAAVFDGSFRNSHLDSFGNTFKMSWFAEMDYLMAQSSFVWGNGSPAGVSGYTAIRDLLVNNWGNEIQTYGDSIEFHHHYMMYNGVWSEDLNGPDASYPQYQMNALDHMIIDRNFYPSTYRSGDWIMTQALSNWLEQWMPFDYTPTSGIWYPVHPTGMDRWQTASPYAPDVPSAVNSAFAYASQHGSAIFSICTHDKENMASQIAWLQYCLDAADANESAYPNVSFKYVSARQAMQQALGFTDSTPPTFTITSSGNTYTITSSEPLWQNHPYIAIKCTNGTYGHMSATPAGTNTWTITPPTGIGAIEKIGVGASDLYGNPGVATATFQGPYTLTVGTVGSGSVVKSPDQPTYAFGTVVTLTAVAAPSWSFSSWSGDLSGSTNPTSLTVTKNMSVTAAFIQNGCTLTVSTAGSGSVVKVPDQASYTSGSVVTLTAAPAPGWSFSSWSGDLSGSANPTTILINGNKTVTATFTQNTYTLTVTVAPAASGSVNLNNTGPYHYGDVVKLTAAPAPGWSFSSWSGDLSGSANPTTIVINGNEAVTANFNTYLFSDGFESEDFSAWTGTTGACTVVEGPAYLGDDAAMFGPWQAYATKTLGSSYTTLYARMYFQLHVLPSADGSMDEILTMLGGSTPAMYIRIIYVTDHLVLRMTSTAPYYINVDYSYAFQIDTWYCLEIKCVKASGTSGEYRSYLNGIDVCDRTGVDTSGLPRLDTIEVGVVNYAIWSDHVYVDCCVMSSFYIGPVTYSLMTTVTPVGSGSVNLNNTGPLYHPGDKVQLTAVPNAGWTFSNWSRDLTGSVNPAVITMNGNKTVTATFTQLQYALTVSASPSGGGTVNRNNTGPYHYGDKVQLTALPTPGWIFSQWSGDLRGFVNPAVITINGNKTVTATFTRLQYTLTTNASPDGAGSVNRNNTGPYRYGERVQLTAVPTVGWAFSSWSGNLTGSLNPAVITIDGNKTVTATFTRLQYTLTITVSPPGSGSVSRNNTGPYHYGDAIQLAATPTTGWAFSSWTGDLTGSVNPAVITMNGNKTVTATSTQIQYTLTVTVSPHGTGSADLNYTGPYHYRDKVELTATANAGWAFSSWSGDLSGTANPTSIFIDGNKTVTANFIQLEYTLTVIVAPANSGSVTLNDSGPHHYGDKVQLTAVPTIGWTFSSWSGDLTGSVTPEVITISGNKTVTATFTQETYPLTLTVSPKSSGSISLNATGPYHYGDKVELTATPAAGWTFSGWSGDLTGNINPDVIAITGNKSVTANFNQLEYTMTITVSPTGSGSVSLNNTGPYYYGDQVQLTAVPAAGWKFSSWSGDLTGSMNPAVITIDGNKTVTASFVQLHYTLTITVSPSRSGSVSLNATGPYHYGDRVELTAVPTADWAFLSWSGDLSGSFNPAVITIDDNKTVTGTFTELQYTLTVAPVGSGSVNLNNTGPYHYGDEVELTAAPNTGWIFSSWTGDLSGSANPAVITISGNKTVTATFTKLPIPGDVNGDGQVDSSDLLIMTKAYGSTPGASNWNLNCDINRDNIVDAADLFILSQNYQETVKNTLTGGHQDNPLNTILLPIPVLPVLALIFFGRTKSLKKRGKNSVRVINYS
jgi:uncharacterized repeat protein (TIGR02543 family)